MSISLQTSELPGLFVFYWDFFSFSIRRAKMTPDIFSDDRLQYERIANFFKDKQSVDETIDLLSNPIASIWHTLVVGSSILALVKKMKVKR